MRDGPVIMREATTSDIAVLAKHRRRMFEDMQVAQGHTYLESDIEAMETEYSRYLHTHLGQAIRAWVIEADGSVIASGAILFQLWAPRPGDRNGKSALLHSIYTAPEFRRRGLARQITQQLVKVCRELGFKTVNLHASQAGRPLYESLGFQPTTEMRLILK
jgi:GNAT superfamily N-acetyltransferase